MREFKGTKGPWAVEKNNIFIEIVQEESGNKIGDTCASGHYFDDGECLNGDVTVANSKLIAAAPELLEALQSLLEDYKEILHMEFNLDGNEITNISEKAINKALGVNDA